MYLSLDLTMPNALALVHQCKLQGGSNDCHLDRKVYPLVGFAVSAFKDPQVRYIDVAFRLDLGPLSNTTCLSSWWFLIVAGKDVRCQRIVVAELLS